MIRKQMTWYAYWLSFFSERLHSYTRAFNIAIISLRAQPLRGEVRGLYVCEEFNKIMKVALAM